MNMISTGAFQTEMDASNRQPTLAKKFAAVWEKKNAKAARAGGVSLMALSLAACGSDDDTTTTAEVVTPVVVTPEVVTPEVVTPVVVAPVVPDTFDLTPLNDVASGTMALNGSLTSTFRFTDGNEVVNGITATMSANDVLIDGSTTDNDVINITGTGTTAMTSVNVETVNLSAASGTVILTATAMTGITAVNVSGTVASEVDNAAQAATIKSDSYGRIINVDADDYAGTAAALNPDSVNLEIVGGTFGAAASTQSGFSLTADNAATIESLNVTSSGAAANTFSVDASTNVTLSTVNFLGAADATVRVTAADVTGLTLVGGAATGAVNLRVDTNSTSAALNASNMSGIDNFLMADSTVGAENASISLMADGQKVTMVDDFAAENTTFTVTGASYAAPAASITMAFDNETANTDVDMQKIDAQNIATLNIESNGFASSSTAATAFNLIDDLTGDATKIVITGDTSLDLDANIDAVQTAGTATTARGVTIDASGMTSTASLDFAAAANSKVSYTVTGTANGDTMVANASGSTLTGGAGVDTLTGGLLVDTLNGGAGKDTMVVTSGADSLTGGSEADTYDVNIQLNAAVAHKVTTGDVDGGLTTVAANDDLIVKLDGAVYKLDVATNGDTADDIAADFVTAFGSSILAAHGVTVTREANAATSGLVFTGKADGTTFTVDSNLSDAGTIVAVTETTNATGTKAGDVASTITDFAVGDIMDTVGLGSLGTGGYYEGAAGAMVAGTAYGMVVLTGASYATWELAETAVAARSTSTSEGAVIFLNSTSGKAELHYEADLGANDTTAAADLMFTFSNVSNLTDLAATMSVDSFII
jgi:hypothetical protein